MLRSSPWPLIDEAKRDSHGAEVDISECVIILNTIFQPFNATLRRLN